MGDVGTVVGEWGMRTWDLVHWSRGQSAGLSYPLRAWNMSDVSLLDIE